ncbi:MAG: TolC family protein [Rhodocyclaceae bacterium]|nr:TolC family protein [Rhodocyclaceae bacterium]
MKTENGKIVKAICLLSGAAWCVAALAQEAWTLDASLKAALSTHPAILSKVSQVTAASAEKKGAEWQRFPTPSVEADGRYTQSVRLDQPLWTGGRITAGIEAAGSRLDAAEAATDEARRDIALKVAAAWSEASRQQMRQAHAVTGVKAHEKLFKLISNRVEREVSPPVDKDFAQSRLLQALNDLSSVTQSLSSARTQLGQLVGGPVPKVTGALEDRGAPANLEAAMGLAVAQSATLKRLAAEEQAADQDVASKRSTLMPQVSLRLQRDLGDPLYIRQDTRAMVVLTAQPGAGLSSVSGVDAAVARREAARLARETALRELRQQVMLDWDELTASRLRLDNARQARTIAAEVFDSYARQYTTGRKSWIDVMNAVREQTQSDMAEADALAQVAAAALRLRIVTGGLALQGAADAH